MEYSVYNSNGFVDVLVRTPFTKKDLQGIGNVSGVKGVYNVGESKIKVKLEVYKTRQIREIIVDVEQLLKKRKLKRLYSLESVTTKRIDDIEEMTGLKKSKVIDKAVEYYLDKLGKVHF